MASLLNLIVIPFLLYPAMLTFDYEVLSDWELKRVAGEIDFSYRDVRVGDTLETREMRMRFPVHATATEMIPFFKNPDLFMAWSRDVDECKLIHDDGMQWTLYKYYNMPWPIAKRDIVTSCTMSVSDSLTHLRITGMDSDVPPRKGVRRIEAYEGQWFIRNVGKDSATVEFRSAQLNRTAAPAGLQEIVIEKSIQKSVERLIQLVQNQ